MGDEDRTAYRSSVFVPNKRRLGNSAKILKIICSIQSRVAVQLVDGAMELIGSAFYDCIHHAAGVLAGVGRGGTDHTDLGNRVQGQAGGGGCGIAAFVQGREVGGWIGVGDAIDIESVGARARTV